MTLSITRDLSDKGVRVCTIEPSLFKTQLLMATLSPEAKASLENMMPFPKKLSDPSEFAQLSRQIVENVMLNGEAIRLNSAIHMTPR